MRDSIDKNVMKILFIDTYSQDGHIQFNRIQLEALCKLGDVYTAMKKGYYEKVGIEQAHKYIEIPEKYYIYETSKLRSILNRVVTRLLSHDLLKEGTLNYVRSQIEDKWDAIIFSHFEPLPLSRMKPLHNVYAISHQYKFLISSCNRFSKKNNRIKYTQDVGSRYTIIALSDSMQRGITDLGAKNVEMVPHGFIPMKGVINTDLLKKFEIPHDKLILFAPSYNNNQEIMDELYGNKDFNQFLKDNNFILVIKDRNGKSNNSYVKVINRWITEEEYQTLFLVSYCMILPYGDSTPYRESGVIMECFANNKPFLKLDIPSLENYNSFIQYESTFSDIESLMKRLNNLLTHKGRFFNNLDSIRNPYFAWVNIFSKKWS